MLVTNLWQVSRTCTCMYIDIMWLPSHTLTYIIACYPLRELHVLLLCLVKYTEHQSIKLYKTQLYTAALFYSIIWDFPVRVVAYGGLPSCAYLE